MRTFINWNRVPSGTGRKPKSGRMRMVLSRRRRAIDSIITLTTDTAVNMEITMPSAMVMAKPRTGPEPNQKSNSVAISAVRLLSITVA